MTYRRVCAFIPLRAIIHSSKHIWTKGTNKGQSDRSAATGIRTDTRTRWEPVQRRPTDLASSWPHRRALKRLQDKLPPSLFRLFLPYLSLSLPPPVLALASVQTTNHIDGFVFNSLKPLSSAVSSLPPALWVTSRNPGRTSPKRCFGRQPALPSQIETILTRALDQGRTSLSGRCRHWSCTFFFGFRKVLKGFHLKDVCNVSWLNTYDYNSPNMYWSLMCNRITIITITIYI